jgi:L-fuculose-phosphate aldolase
MPPRTNKQTQRRVNSVEALARREICAAGRRLRELGFLPAAAGNLSVRLGDGTILATPSGVPKGELAPRQLIVLCMSNEPRSARRGRGNGGTQTAALRERSGQARVSSEIQMHLRIYALRPDVRAICHAHPPVATGFAAAGRALDRAVLGETAILLGAVPLAPFGAPGTQGLPESITPYVPRANAILLANHGVVAYGEDLRTALQRMELVEHCARVTLVAELAGGARLLSRAQVEALVAARPRYGFAPLPPDAVRWLTAEDV